MIAFRSQEENRRYLSGDLGLTNLRFEGLMEATEMLHTRFGLGLGLLTPDESQSERIRWYGFPS